MMPVGARSSSSSTMMPVGAWQESRPAAVAPNPPPPNTFVATDGQRYFQIPDSVPHTVDPEWTGFHTRHGPQQPTAGDTTTASAPVARATDAPAPFVRSDAAPLPVRRRISADREVRIAADPVQDHQNHQEDPRQQEEVPPPPSDEDLPGHDGDDHVGADWMSAASEDEEGAGEDVELREALEEWREALGQVHSHHSPEDILPDATTLEEMDPGDAVVAADG